MTTRNMGYDHPAYLAREPVSLGAVTAGAAAVTPKFVAFANMQIYSITATAVAAGTSTYTAWNGTATTIAVGAQTFSLIRITNTAALGAAPSLATSTYGPYALSNYNGTATGTQTNSSAPGYTCNVAVYGTGAGSAAGAGGVSVNQGDQLYIVQGTDATAVGAYTLEVGVTPFASVTV